MHSINIQGLFSWKMLAIAAVAIVIQTIFVLCYANAYGLLLKANCDTEFMQGSTIREYCRSNLLKYLPGNIFHYIGRNQIAIEQGIPYSDVNSTTIVEMSLLLIAGTMNTMIFSGRYAYWWIIENSEVNVFFALITIVTIVLITMVIHRTSTRFRNINHTFGRRLKNIGYVKSVKFIFFYMIIFIVSGFAFILVLHSLNGNIPPNLIFLIIGLYSFSWMIGFITPGAPAGLGVREAIMSTLLSGIANMGIIITTVLLFRMVTIFADILAYLFSKYSISLNSGQ